MASLESRIKELSAKNEPGPKDSICQVIKTFGFKAVTCVGIYLLGYCDVSIAWLIPPLFIMVLHEQCVKRKERRFSSARQAARTNEKSMIESCIRVADLPSWVIFPDKVIYIPEAIYENHNPII